MLSLAISTILKTIKKDRKMKDIILSLIILISLIYIGLIILIIFFIFAWASLGATDSLFMGEWINFFILFNKESPMVIYITCGFCVIFIAYKIKHEKNKKRKKEEQIYSGSLIGKPLPTKHKK